MSIFSPFLLNFSITRISIVPNTSLPSQFKYRWQLLAPSSSTQPQSSHKFSQSLFFSARFEKSIQRIYSNSALPVSISFSSPFTRRGGPVPQGHTVHTRRWIGSRHGWFPCQGDHRLRATGADVERLYLDNIPTDFPYGAGSPSTRKIPRLMREIVLFLANPRKYRAIRLFITPTELSSRKWIQKKQFTSRFRSNFSISIA